jgi:hypothetical protein
MTTDQSRWEGVAADGHRGNASLAIKIVTGAISRRTMLHAFNARAENGFT